MWLVSRRLPVTFQNGSAHTYYPFKQMQIPIMALCYTPAANYFNMWLCKISHQFAVEPHLSGFILVSVVIFFFFFLLGPFLEQKMTVDLSRKKRRRRTAKKTKRMAQAVVRLETGRT